MTILEWHLIGVIVFVLFLWARSDSKRVDEINAVLWKLREAKGWREITAMGTRVQMPPPRS